jgi:hypothetical protein
VDHRDDPPDDEGDHGDHDEDDDPGAHGLSSPSRSSDSGCWALVCHTM